MGVLFALIEKLIGPIIVKVLVSYLERRETDEKFKARSLPAREKLRAATNAREARDASKAIHRLLAGE